MANPKLEVYQIRLKPSKEEYKTFKDFFNETGLTEKCESKKSTIFSKYFDKFIHKIDTNDFIGNPRKKKAFTAYDTRPIGEGTPTIKFYSEKEIIEGTIEGGKYGQKRNKSSIKNKLEKENITQANIILDKFYFCLSLL